MGMGGSFAKTKEAQAAMVMDGNLPSKLEGRNSFFFLTLGFPWPSKLGQGSSHSGFQYAHVIVWQNLKLNWPARHVLLAWLIAIIRQ
ncbi:hypothetical protein BDV30DRAFT_232107 [Aspergillus minisclerotigenes]|uniref:Uncharacterized protein n=1 Tax=Aspergillus minisclerotigenes TaxID=656917 RepID=A0A5N6IJE3_9EURO|nr:hypothetical protein BDV30DRAFT_232107 [Aspergillus minisclerotigenes]